MESWAYAEIKELYEFYNLSPFGEARADLRMAIQACASVNAMGGKTKPKDFLPDFTRETKPMTPGQMQVALRTIMRVENG